MGAASFLFPAFSQKAVSRQKNGEYPDICIVNGENIFDNTKLLVDTLGGTGRFVSGGQKVGLLINSEFENRGAYVSPDMTLSVAKMCFDAGASEVRCLQFVSPEYWRRSKYAEDLSGMIEKIVINDYNQSHAEFDPDHFSRVDVSGKALKEAEVVDDFFSCDVYINISIAKHHGSTIYTGTMKNTMGINTRENCVSFHTDGPTRNDADFLAQCIADLNTLRKPDICLVDVSEVLVTNGPSGPGDVINPGKVVAGTDMVAVDSLCTTLINHEYGDILSVVKGHETGLGDMDFKKMKIEELHA